MVPYDCDFFIVLPTDSNNYQIIKIYTLGEQRIFEDYAAYINHSCSFSDVLKYPAKVDMNHTKFYLMIGNCTEVRISAIKF